MSPPENKPPETLTATIPEGENPAAEQKKLGREVKEGPTGTVGKAVEAAKNYIDASFTPDNAAKLANLTNAWNAWDSQSKNFNGDLFLEDLFKSGARGAAELAKNLEALVQNDYAQYKHERETWRTEVAKHLIKKAKNAGKEWSDEQKEKFIVDIMAAQKMNVGALQALEDAKKDLQKSDPALADGQARAALATEMEKGNADGKPIEGLLTTMVPEYFQRVIKDGGIHIMTGLHMVTIPNNLAGQIELKNMTMTMKGEEGSEKIYAQMKNGCEGNLVIIDVEKNKRVGSPDDTPAKPRKDDKPRYRVKDDPPPHNRVVDPGDKKTGKGGGQGGAQTDDTHNRIEDPSGRPARVIEDITDVRKNHGGSEGDKSGAPPPIEPERLAPRQSDKPADPSPDQRSATDKPARAAQVVDVVEIKKTTLKQFSNLGKIEELLRKKGITFEADDDHFSIENKEQGKKFEIFGTPPYHATFINEGKTQTVTADTLEGLIKILPSKLPVEKEFKEVGDAWKEFDNNAQPVAEGPKADTGKEESLTDTADEAEARKKAVEEGRDFRNEREALKQGLIINKPDGSPVPKEGTTWADPDRTSKNFMTITAKKKEEERLVDPKGESEERPEMEALLAPLNALHGGKKVKITWREKVEYNTKTVQEYIPNIAKGLAAAKKSRPDGFKDLTILLDDDKLHDDEGLTTYNGEQVIEIDWNQSADSIQKQIEQGIDEMKAEKTVKAEIAAIRADKKIKIEYGEDIDQQTTDFWQGVKENLPKLKEALSIIESQQPGKTWNLKKEKTKTTKAVNLHAHLRLEKGGYRIRLEKTAKEKEEKTELPADTPLTIGYGKDASDIAEFLAERLYQVPDPD